MPELPEITNLARQLDERLKRKIITRLEILQPKCLNVSPEVFTKALLGAQILSAENRGKWIVIHTDKGYFLLSLGMGGEVLLVTRSDLPQKYRLLVDFTHQTCLAINFWWFGYAHYMPKYGLKDHPMVGKLGQNALDISLEEFFTLARDQRGHVKAFLLNQTRIAGIGNAYIHDILFFARLHPQRKMVTLSDTDIERLYQAIRAGLEPSLKKGGAFYEVDTYGKPGGFLSEDIVIGYRESTPCPVCGTTIIKIKTGSTSSFICPTCQN